MNAELKLIQMLMEIGYLAGGYGLTREAEIIFEGIRAVRPDSVYPCIGMAVAKLNDGNSAEAVRILRDEALGRDPESDLAKSFLGLALKASGMISESEKVLAEVVSSGRNDEAFRMAQSLLEEIKG